MVTIIEQTDEEKLAMYMKCSKTELAKMLIQCNKIIDHRPQFAVTDNAIILGDGIYIKQE